MILPEFDPFVLADVAPVDPEHHALYVKVDCDHCDC